MLLEPDVGMDAEQNWNMRRRLLEEREHQFMQSLNELGPDEMRWLIRYLADALTEERWRTLLAGYDESLPLEQTRQFLEGFIPECTRLGILDLQAKRDAEAESLQSLTDTDLQSMSAMEKWQMMAREPRDLDPYRTARELARLAFCFEPDLLHDAMLPRAAIEYPFYFRLQKGLRRLPQTDIYRLADAAAASLPAVEQLPAAKRAERLASIRRDIAQAAGFMVPVEELLGASMQVLPREFFPSSERQEMPEDRLAERLRQLEGLLPEDLRLRLQVQSDQLSLRESQELLDPYRSQYASIGQMPVETLRRLVTTLDVHLQGRSVCDFFQRYRTGKFLTTPPVTAEVWNLLPQEDRQQLLAQDDAQMDIAQMARHLAKILSSREYRMLDDAASQMTILISPRYLNLVQRLTRLGEENGKPKIVTLNHSITRRMLEMEQSPREERAEKLDRIRRLIGETLGLSEQDMAALDT
jgi:hypothetical protein